MNPGTQRLCHGTEHDDVRSYWDRQDAFRSWRSGGQWACRWKPGLGKTRMARRSVRHWQGALTHRAKRGWAVFARSNKSTG